MREEQGRPETLGDSRGGIGSCDGIKGDSTYKENCVQVVFSWVQARKVGTLAHRLVGGRREANLATGDSDQSIMVYHSLRSTAAAVLGRLNRFRKFVKISYARYDLHR